MKKQNARIAKELVKIAKDLMAVNVDENFSDLTWVAINKILNETEFLQALNDYITIKESIISILSGINGDLQDSKSKLAGVLSQYNQFKNLNNDEMEKRIDEIIATARNKMPKGGVHQDVNNNIYFQRFIESLVEIKRRFILYKTKGGNLQVTTVKNARGLMSRIAEILHNDYLNFLTGNSQYQQIDELTNLKSLLQARGMKLTNQDSKQFGDKNISDKVIDKVNKNDLRPRLKQASEQMRKFISQNQQYIKDISNQRFYITKISDKVTGNFNTTIGFFTSINTLLLNWLSDVRRKEGLMDIQHDIPQSDSAQLEMAQELKINPDKLKIILQKLKEIQNPGVTIDEIKNFLKTVASKFNLNENELQNELDVFLKSNAKIKKKINEKNLTKLFDQILSNDKFQNIDPLFLYSYIDTLKQGSNMKQFKKKDLESLFETKDFANLEDDQKEALLNYLNNNRLNLYDEREMRIASKLAVEAGMLDNIKEFFINVMNKAKGFFTSIKDKFNKMIASFIPQKEIEKDMNALDEKTKRVTLLMQKMERIDNELGSLLNTLNAI